MPRTHFWRNIKMQRLPYFALQMIAAIALSAMMRVTAAAQNKRDSTAGQFSLGMRTTVSSFTDAGSAGLGAGGQFWIRVSKHLNTIWYADYINTNIQNMGYRKDGHIGWSVVFYMDKKPLMTHKLTPYIVAGQCFDYTLLYSDYLNASAQRWSAAAPQAGAGITFKINRDFDISLLVQYMLHLGTHIESKIITDDYGNRYLDISHEPGASLDGHLLCTFSVNYMIGKL